MTAQPTTHNPKRALSPEALAYLEQERVAQFKSEFHGGIIVAMAGTSLPHNAILVNLTAELRNALKLTSCKNYASDVRVFAEKYEAYFYPDVVIVCGTPELTATTPPAVSNPFVIFEVLSDSTEGNDRGYKFECYRTVPSLREYVLIAQNKIQVEHYVRQNDTMWLLTILTGKDAILNLESCHLSLPLSEIYARVFTP